MFFGCGAVWVGATYGTSALMNISFVLAFHSLRRKTGSVYALPALTIFLAFYQMEKLFFGGA
jgi:hypothetical protein